MLILVEFQEDVAQAVRIARQARASGESARLIALSPEVMEAVELAGEAYELATTIVQEEQLNAVAEENLSRVTRLAEVVDGLVADQLPEVSPRGFSPIRCHLHEVVTLMDSVAFRCTQLERLVQRFRPSQVAYFWNQRQTMAQRGILFGPGEFLWGRLCRHLRLALADVRPPWAQPTTWTEWSSGASAQAVQARIQRQNPARVSRSWLQLLSRLRWFCDDTVSLWRLSRARARHGPVSGPAPRRLLFLGWLSPDLRAIMKQLRHEPGTRVWRWALPDSIPRTAAGSARIDRRLAWSDRKLVARLTPEWLRLWVAFEQHDEVRRLLSWSGLSGLAASRDKWAHLFRTQLPQTLALYLRARRYLTAVRPQLIVHAEVGYLSWYRTVLEAAWQLGLSNLFYQNGGYTGYVRQPYLELTELQSHYVAAYTAEVANVLAEQVQRNQCARATIHVGGSPHLAQVSAAVARARAITPPSRKRLTYVTSAFHGASRYGPYHCLDDTLYYHLERRVLMILVEEVPGEIVLKVRPRRVKVFDPIDAWIARRRLPVTIVRQPLERVLHRSDAWIVDGPSTALQLVLLTGQPVIYVHTRGMELYPDAWGALRQQVQVLDGWDADFDQQLRIALRNLWLAPASREDRFVREFAFPGGDPDEVTQTAVRKLLELAGRVEAPEAAREMAETLRC